MGTVTVHKGKGKRGAWVLFHEGSTVGGEYRTKRDALARADEYVKGDDETVVDRSTRAMPEGYEW